MKARTHLKAHLLKREGGQGLVEMALILPFLLVLVIGIVELGVALNRQLTVVNAAREGARFGAQGATASNIYLETLEATSKMFAFTEENAVVVVIHAKTNEAGTDFTEWLEKIYPEGSTVPHVTRPEVLAELQAEGNAGNVRLVAVDVEYDHQAILGLPFVSALAGQIPIGSWTVMRLVAPGEGTGKSASCCVYPITLDWKTINWPDGFDKDTPMPDIRIGTDASQFGWIYWDPDDNAPAETLAENLKNACSGTDQFKNGCHPEDTTLNSGDWISGDQGESVANAVKNEVEALQEKGYIRIPIWDEFHDCNDMSKLHPEEQCNCRVGKDVVHIVGFAIVEVTGVNLTSTPKVIKANFIRFDEGCDTE